MTIVYRHARHVYQALFNRRYARHRSQMRQLLRPFVKPGALVFDIGANKGDYVDVLLSLGARVVAVEPNPELARTLRRHYGVTVEQAALGEETGSLDLHLGHDAGHSTLSDRWVRLAPGRNRWANSSIRVHVTTFDDLVARYGAPAFSKIDVEGFEAQVLRGCTSAPPALSFEYQCADLSVAEECLALLSGYEFNSVQLIGTRFSGGWVSAEEVLHRLGDERRLNPTLYGDVYARRTERPAERTFP